jgi:uncharacterized protein (DUF58 family)
MTDSETQAWGGAGGRRTARPRFTWNAVLWALVYPRRGNRIVPTVPGTVLVAVSLGIGMAAYNSSSNILFLTLALLLACLILSGVLSWLNLRGVDWRLQVAPALRAGHDTMVGLQLRNRKRFLPTYGLTFELAARRQSAPGTQRAESTLTARGEEIRAALAKAEADEFRGEVGLAGRLDPASTVQLDWVFRPARRGRLRIELASVGSFFPFGFLRKHIGTSLAEEVIVWPPPTEYRRHAAPAARRQPGDERTTRAGSGNDLIAVRRYHAGDSHRLIHWKASARTGQLLVRQFAAETAQGYHLWLRTDAATWPRGDQFETLISFAATLAEDLFRAGRLLTVAVNGDAPQPVRGVRDLEGFLNRIAVVEPAEAPAGNRRLPGRNVLTFAPEGARGVAAYIDGQSAASV